MRKIKEEPQIQEASVEKSPVQRLMELKAADYDLIAQIEYFTKMHNQVQAQIRELIQQIEG